MNFFAISICTSTDSFFEVCLQTFLSISAQSKLFEQAKEKETNLEAVAGCQKELARLKKILYRFKITV